MADITSLAPVLLSDKAKQYLESFGDYYDSLMSNTVLILQNMWNLDYTDSDTVFYDTYTYNPFLLPNASLYPLIGNNILPFLPNNVSQRRFKPEYQNVIDKISALFGISMGDLSFFDVEIQDLITFNRFRNIMQFYKNKMNRGVYDFIFYLFSVNAKIYSLGTFDYLVFYRYDDATDIMRDEYNGTGDGISTTFTYTLFKTPIQASTYHVYVNSTEMGRDDGSGNITGTGISWGTIDYQTGLVQIDFATVPTLNSVVNSTYNYTIYNDTIYSDTNTLLDMGYLMSNLYKTPFIEIEINMLQYYTVNGSDYLWYDLIDSYISSQIEQVRYALSKIYYTLRLDVDADCETAAGAITTTNSNNKVVSITYNDGIAWATKYPLITSYEMVYDDASTATGFLYDKVHDTDKRVGLGNGTETVFTTKITQHIPIVPTTATLEYTVGGVTITSNPDAGGFITGTNIDLATIDYTTGEVGVAFLTPPDDSTTIKIYYDAVYYYFYVKHTETTDKNLVGFNITNQANTETYIAVTFPEMYSKANSTHLLTVVG